MNPLEKKNLQPYNRDQVAIEHTKIENQLNDRIRNLERNVFEEYDSIAESYNNVLTKLLTKEITLDETGSKIEDLIQIGLFKAKEESDYDTLAQVHKMATECAELLSPETRKKVELNTIKNSISDTYFSCMDMLSSDRPGDMTEIARSSRNILYQNHLKNELKLQRKEIQNPFIPIIREQIDILEEISLVKRNLITSPLTDQDYIDLRDTYPSLPKKQPPKEILMSQLNIIEENQLQYFEFAVIATPYTLYSEEGAKIAGHAIKILASNNYSKTKNEIFMKLPIEMHLDLKEYHPETFNLLEKSSYLETSQKEVFGRLLEIKHYKRNNLNNYLKTKDLSSSKKYLSRAKTELQKLFTMSDLENLSHAKKRLLTLHTLIHSQEFLSDTKHDLLNILTVDDLISEAIIYLISINCEDDDYDSELVDIVVDKITSIIIEKHSLISSETLNEAASYFLEIDKEEAALKFLEAILYNPETQSFDIKHPAFNQFLLCAITIASDRSSPDHHYGKMVMDIIKKNVDKNSLFKKQASLYDSLPRSQLSKSKLALGKAILRHRSSLKLKGIFKNIINDFISANDRKTLSKVIQFYIKDASDPDDIRAILNAAAYCGDQKTYDLAKRKMGPEGLSEYDKVILDLQLDIGKIISKNGGVTCQERIVAHEKAYQASGNDDIKEALVTLYLMNGDLDKIETIQEMSISSHFNTFKVDILENTKNGLDLKKETIEAMKDIGLIIKGRHPESDISEDRIHSLMSLLYGSIDNPDLNKICWKINSMSPEEAVEYLNRKGIPSTNLDLGGFKVGLERFASISYYSKNHGDIYEQFLRLERAIDRINNNLPIMEHQRLSMTEIGSVMRYVGASENFNEVFSSLNEHLKNKEPIPKHYQHFAKIVNQIKLNISQFDEEVKLHFQEGDILFHDNILEAKLKGVQSMASMDASDIFKVLSKFVETQNAFSVQPYFTGKYSHAGLTINYDGNSSIMDVVNESDIREFDIDEALVTEGYRPNPVKFFSKEALEFLKSEGLDINTFFKNHCTSYISNEGKRAYNWNISNSSNLATGAFLKSLGTYKTIKSLAEFYNKVNPDESTSLILEEAFETSTLDIIDKASVEEVNMFCSHFVSVMFTRGLQNLNSELNSLAESKGVTLDEGVNFPIPLDETDFSKYHPNLLKKMIEPYFEPLPQTPTLSKLLKKEEL